MAEASLKIVYSFSFFCKLYLIYFVFPFIKCIFAAGLLATATCRTLPQGFKFDMLVPRVSRVPYVGVTSNILTRPFAPCYSPFGSENAPDYLDNNVYIGNKPILKHGIH